MHIILHIPMNQAFFEEFYEQSFLYRMKYRKYAPYLGALYIVGVFLIIYLNMPKPNYLTLFWALLGFVLGVRTLYENKLAKRKWMKERSSTIALQKIITWTFKEEDIHAKNKLSEHTIQWEAIQEAQETAKGIFMTVGKGSSFYLPKASFSKEEEIKLLLEKLEKLPNASVKKLIPNPLKTKKTLDK